METQSSDDPRHALTYWTWYDCRDDDDPVIELTSLVDARDSAGYDYSSVLDPWRHTVQVRRPEEDRNGCLTSHGLVRSDFIALLIDGKS
nr:hypothetical protein BgiMline_023675 [Biomphalaria glabrata]